MSAKFFQGHGKSRKINFFHEKVMERKVMEERFKIKLKYASLPSLCQTWVNVRR